VRRSHPELVAANRRRTAAAARRNATRATQVLTDRLPPAWAEAAHLRAAYPHLSLAELAAKASPPVTKDAFAARLRRALTCAETHTEAPARNLAQPGRAHQSSASRGIAP
jgi:cell division protein WhiA